MIINIPTFSYFAPVQTVFFPMISTWTFTNAVFWQASGNIISSFPVRIQNETCLASSFSVVVVGGVV